MKRLWTSIASIVGLAAVIVGCGSTQPVTETIAGLDALGEIHVVAREEGSGTRGVFAEKVNLEDNTSSSNADRITDRAQIAMNAASVLDIVSKDTDAIGFVSIGAVTGEETDVKVIAVDGVTPDSATMASDEYPLTRNFYIAYSGKITEGGSDFLRYILSAGQGIVEESYIKVKNTDSFLSDQSKGKLTISGSSSAAPLLEQLATDYNENYNAELNISVQTTDSTSGLTAAMQGSSDWGMASRALKDYEEELLTYETIAKDGIAVVVNADNPVTSLTIDQLTQIFDGTDEKWDDINKE